MATALSQQRTSRHTSTFSVKQHTTDGSRIGWLAKRLRLSSVMQSGSNAVNGCAQRIFKFLQLLPLLLPPQEFNLDQAHRIHIRIAQMNRSCQHAVARQQISLTRNSQN